MGKVLAGDNTYGGTARQNFIAAFHQLVEENNIDNISIQKICDKAGYCRKHYYNLFKNKNELLKLSLLNDVDTIAGSFNFPTMEKMILYADLMNDVEFILKLTSKYIEYYQKNASYYRNILDSSEIRLLKSFFYSLTNQVFMSIAFSLINNPDDMRLKYLPSTIAHGSLPITLKALECCAYEKDLEIPYGTVIVYYLIMLRSIADHHAERLSDAVSTSASLRNMTYFDLTNVE